MTTIRDFLDDTSIPFQNIATALALFSWAFEAYVNSRQFPRLRLSAPPPSLHAVIAETKKAEESSEKSHAGTEAKPDILETFRRSQAYALDKLGFSTVKDVVGVLEFAVITTSLLQIAGIVTGQGSSWTPLVSLWELAGKVLGLASDYMEMSELKQSLVFLVIMSLLGDITGIPFSLYSTFVLEERHGFNKTTFGTWMADLVKGNLLSALLGLPLMAAVLKIIAWAGDRFVPYTMALIIAIQLILIPIAPYTIAPLFNKYTPLESLPEHAKVFTLTKELATKLKFPLGRVWVVDGSRRSAHSNAFFFGLPGLSKHIVIYDTLLATSTPEEVEAVLAHELGHWHYSHPLRMFFMSQLNTFVILSLLGLCLPSRALPAAFGFHPDHAPLLIRLHLAQTLFSPLSVIVGFTTHAFSRQLEFQADDFAKNLSTQYADKLKEALKRLVLDNKALTDVDWLYSAFNYSHPTVAERIARLSQHSSGKATSKKEL